MKLISVNIGNEQEIPNAKKYGKTGIYKNPVNTPMNITPLGLAEDTICDVKHHGGPDQALYLYGQPDYDWWSQTLGYILAPGTFGENLTIDGLESARFAVGDRLVIGAGEAPTQPVILEVTAPRIPCGTLAARMGDAQFVKRFRAAERPGLYCRVIQEGRIQAGDPVTLEAYPGGDRLLIVELFRDHYEPDRSAAALRRHLAAPIDIRSRRDKEEQLRQTLNP